MCTQSDTPHWPETLRIFAWRHRSTIRDAVAVAAVFGSLGCLLAYLVKPTDIERAEADLKKASAVVKAMNDEAAEALDEADHHRERAEHHQACLNEKPNTADSDWVEWQQSKRDSHRQISRAKRDRRDNLVHLTAGYWRLLAEAESEILRAKDARDRGTPYKVAPRVRDLLAPVLGSH